MRRGAIDGIRNRWQELFHITLPSMGPQLQFGAVMQIGASFSVAGVAIAIAGQSLHGQRRRHHRHPYHRHGQYAL